MYEETSTTTNMRKKVAFEIQQKRFNTDTRQDMFQVVPWNICSHKTCFKKHVWSTPRYKVFFKYQSYVNVRVEDVLCFRTWSRRCALYALYKLYLDVLADARYSFGWQTGLRFIAFELYTIANVCFKIY